MKVKDNFLSIGSFYVGNGINTRLWEDTRLGDMPYLYPSIHNIVK
jgi:hypothetical protein